MLGLCQQVLINRHVCAMLSGAGPWIQFLEHVPALTPQCMSKCLPFFFLKG